MASLAERDHPMRTHHWWRAAWAFAALELACIGIAKTSAMGLATGGTYGRMRDSLLMRVHVWSSMIMWGLGSVQLLGKGLRRARPKLHRALGLLFLLDWALLCGPTSFYLSLYLRTNTLLGTLGSLTLLDVTALSYYFFWRAWRVARARAQGVRSLQLHGNLMGFGVIGTMNQLPQRFFMAVMLLARAAARTALLWLGARPAAAALRDSVTDEAIFGLSMLLGPCIVLMLVDGPRTRVARRSAEGTALRQTLWGASEVDEREMYAYDVEARATRWRWRARIAVYALARGLVTDWWTRPPPGGGV